MGESLVDALARELLEETGLKTLLLGVVEVLDRVLRARDGRVRYHYVLIDYLCVPAGGRLRSGSDAREARWVERRNLTDYSLRPETERVIEKAFALIKKARGRTPSRIKNS